MSRVQDAIDAGGNIGGYSRSPSASAARRSANRLAGVPICGDGIITATDAATVTFDLSLGLVHTLTLGGNRTLVVTHEEAGNPFTIILIQGSGGQTVTWFSTIKWPGGTVPTLSTGSGDIDVFSFLPIAADSYYGFTVGQDLS